MCNLGITISLKNKMLVENSLSTKVTRYLKLMLAIDILYLNSINYSIFKIRLDILFPDRNGYRLTDL